MQKIMLQDIKKYFPILDIKPYEKDLVYLDSAATSQKPIAVMDSMSHFLMHHNANVSRGVYYLTEHATEAYENTRQQVQRFINAKSADEIIFTNSTTDAINIVADTFGMQNIKANDEIVVTIMEHHSNLLPWYNLAKKTGAIIRTVSINDQYELDISQLESILNEKTKILAITHASNVLGTINPIKAIVRLARKYDICVVVDGAQAVPHITVDVQDIDCDFYAFSSHKLYGPTGIGVLYGKRNILNKMPPRNFGGGMVLSAEFDHLTYREIPYKFEAGSANVMAAVGLSAAIDFFQSIDHTELLKHENDICSYAISALSNINGASVHCANAKNNIGLASFSLDKIHPHDIGTVLDREGIAVRTGHHCAQPLMQHLGVTSTARISIGCYNTKQDIDEFISGIKKVIEVLR